MRKVNDGEKQSPSYTRNDRDANVVDIIHYVKQDKDAPTFEMKWSLDFTDIDRDTLVELASRTIHIRLQGDWRKDPRALAEPSNWEKVHSVKGYLERERKRGGTTANPLEAAMKALNKMSVEEKALLLKALGVGGSTE